MVLPHGENFRTSRGILPEPLSTNLRTWSFPGSHGRARLLLRIKRILKTGEPIMQPSYHADADPHASHCDERALRARVSAEFQEMPGLKITLAQAARMFSLDAARCERVLGSLVDVGALSTDGHAFARAENGRDHA
jgi:hypothetical protein